MPASRPNSPAAKRQPAPGHRLRRDVAGCLALVTVLIVIGGCGGDDGEDATSSSAVEAPRLSLPPGLPRTSNRSMRELLRNLRQGPVLAPSVSVLEPGRNRFAFALFDRGNKQIADLNIGLYFSRGLDETAHGPFPVRFERIDVEPRYRSRQTVEDPDAARSVYVSQVNLRQAGGYVVSAVAELGDQLVATSPVQVTASASSGVPGPGDPAIRVHTPTKASVGGDLSKIDTRDPHDSMHDVDLADALDDRRPILLLFSTPALCESRVCGPVTDVAEQVKDDYDDHVDFIHMEIYKDNDPNKGVRPQVRAWRLSKEPFVFAINAEGKVVDRIQGAFSARELTAMVRKALR